MKAAALVLLLPSLWLAAAAPPPVIERPVTDPQGLLTTEQKDTVASELVRLRLRTGAQMAVLIVDSTGEEPLEDYAMRTARAWRGGQGGADNGLLYVLAVKDRRMRLDVGYGLEASLPDDAVRRLLDAQGPLLREQDYTGALTHIIQGVGERLSSLEEGGAAVPSTRGQRFSLMLGAFLVLVLSVVGCAVLHPAREGAAIVWATFASVMVSWTILLLTPIPPPGATLDVGLVLGVLGLGGALMFAGGCLVRFRGWERWGISWMVGTLVGLGSACLLTSPRGVPVLFILGVSLAATPVLWVLTFIPPFHFLLRVLAFSAGREWKVKPRAPSPWRDSSSVSSTTWSASAASSDSSSSSSSSDSSSSYSSSDSSSSSSGDWGGGGGDFGGGGSSSSW